MPYTTRRLGVIVVILAVLALVGSWLYKTVNQTFQLPVSTTAGLAVINPEELTSWLPNDAYNYTIARLSDYAAQQGLAATSLAIGGSVSTLGNGYHFSVILLPQQKTVSVVATVTNFDSVISTTVDVDGTPIGATIQTSSDTQYENFDDFFSNSLTIQQISSLKSAFHKFKPTAGTINLDTNSIQSNPNNPDATVSFIFTVSVDGHDYHATLDLPGLTEARLRIVDPQTNKQIFDSGDITSS